MHCKDDYDSMFLRPLGDLLVVLRKPWICTHCFDAHFQKFRDFWWFLVILIENGHFGPLFEDLWQPPSKSHDISAFNPMDPLRTLFWTQKPLSKVVKWPKLEVPLMGWEVWAGPSAQRQLLKGPSCNLLQDPQKGPKWSKLGSKICKVPEGPSKVPPGQSGPNVFGTFWLSQAKKFDLPQRAQMGSK